MSQKRHAFVIRLWNEAREQPTKQQPVVVLRGSLQAGGSDKIYYFDSFDKIPDLLKQITEWENKLE